MSKIDPTARIEDGAVIGDSTTIGPYCVIGGNAAIGTGCTLTSHVTVSGHTRIGNDCTISPFAALGGPPQDRIRDEFKHASQISVEIADPHVQVSGATATATFLRRYDILTVEGQRLHSESQCVMELRRNGNNWVIERIRFTPLR